MPLHDTRKEVPPDDTRVLGYYLDTYNLTTPLLYKDGKWELDDEQGYAESIDPPDAWQEYATRDEVIALLKGE